MLNRWYFILSINVYLSTLLSRYHPNTLPKIVAPRRPFQKAPQGQISNLAIAVPTTNACGWPWLSAVFFLSLIAAPALPYSHPFPIPFSFICSRCTKNASHEGETKKKSQSPKIKRKQERWT